MLQVGGPGGSELHPGEPAGPMLVAQGCARRSGIDDTAARPMNLQVAAYTVPTEAPESDGTAEWDSTTVVLVELEHRGARGIGYTFADEATARAASLLAPHLESSSPYNTRSIFRTCVTILRNHGRGGASAMAISAIDCAAWDLKARLLGVPLAQLLGTVRPEVPAYGSGGFTSLSEPQLCEQL